MWCLNISGISPVYSGFGGFCPKDSKRNVSSDDEALCDYRVGSLALA